MSKKYQTVGLVGSGHLICQWLRNLWDDSLILENVREKWEGHPMPIYTTAMSSTITEDCCTKAWSLITRATDQILKSWPHYFLCLTKIYACCKLHCNWLSHWWEIMLILLSHWSGYIGYFAHLSSLHFNNYVECIITILIHANKCF